MECIRVAKCEYEFQLNLIMRFINFSKNYELLVIMLACDANKVDGIGVVIY